MIFSAPKNSNNTQKKIQSSKKNSNDLNNVQKIFKKEKEIKSQKNSRFTKRNTNSPAHEKRTTKDKKSNFTKTKKNDKLIKTMTNDQISTILGQEMMRMLVDIHHNDKTRVSGKALCVLCAARLTRLVPDAFLQICQKIQKFNLFFLFAFFLLSFCLFGEGWGFVIVVVVVVFEGGKEGRIERVNDLKECEILSTNEDIDSQLRAHAAGLAGAKPINQNIKTKNKNKKSQKPNKHTNKQTKQSF